MPTIKASRNSIISVVTGIQTMDPGPDLSITWVHGVARNVKLTTDLLAEWKAKSEDVNSEAYLKYMEASTTADGDTKELDEKYKDVLADREALIEAANAWLAEEIDQEVYAWPLESLPADIDRRFVIALTDWIKD
jgi:hypothetical protein